MAAATAAAASMQCCWRCWLQQPLQRQQQQQQAQHTIDALKTEGLNIVTELSPAPQFYPAEDYHQNFFARNPAQGYCNFTIPPKLMKLRSKFQDLLKPE